MAVRLLLRHAIVLDEHWGLLRELLVIGIARKLLLSEMLML